MARSPSGAPLDQLGLDLATLTVELAPRIGSEETKGAVVAGLPDASPGGVVSGEDKEPALAAPLIAKRWS